MFNYFNYYIQHLTLQLKITNIKLCENSYIISRCVTIKDKISYKHQISNVAISNNFIRQNFINIKYILLICLLIFSVIFHFI